MSPPAKRVPDCEYLFDRGGRHTVRVQVPRHLKAALGKGEFKKSLGGDLALAKRKYHSVVAAFMAEIEAARRGAVQRGAPQAISAKPPTVEDVEAACYAHFVRMTLKMRGKVAHPVGDNPRELGNLAEGYRIMIQSQVAAHAYDAWESMVLDAKWLCEEHGWTIDPETGLFEHLCKRCCGHDCNATATNFGGLKARWVLTPTLIHCSGVSHQSAISQRWP